MGIARGLGGRRRSSRHRGTGPRRARSTGKRTDDRVRQRQLQQLDQLLGQRHDFGWAAVQRQL